MVLVGHSFGGARFPGSPIGFPNRSRRSCISMRLCSMAGRTPSRSILRRGRSRDRCGRAGHGWSRGSGCDPPHCQTCGGSVARANRTMTGGAAAVTTPAGDLHDRLDRARERRQGMPRTYVLCSQPPHPALEASRRLVRSWSGCGWIEFCARLVASSPIQTTSSSYC